MRYSQCVWQEGMSVSSHQRGYYRWKTAFKLDFFCWFVLGAWIQSVTVRAHLQILINHTEMPEFNATSFVKEVFIPHKSEQEQEWLDSKCLSREGRKAQSRPVQYPFSPRAKGHANISELLPVSDLCHGKIIVLYFKMLYNTTTCLCLTHIHLDCCNLLWRMHTALAIEVALNSCVQNSSFSTNYVKSKFYTSSSPRQPVSENMFPVV